MKKMMNNLTMKLDDDEMIHDTDDDKFSLFRTQNINLKNF